MALVNLHRLDEYEPSHFAGSFLSRVPTERRRDFPLFHVQPRLNDYLFDRLADVYKINLYVFSCDSMGRRRTFVSVHGGTSPDNVFICYVSDAIDFSQADSILQPKRRINLSRESTDIIARAMERLSLSLPNLDVIDEEEDPARPPLQKGHLPSEAERWVLVQQSDSFFKVFVCRRGCQGVFLRAHHRVRHEALACNYDPSLPLSEQSCKVRYTTRLFTPQDRIQDLFSSIGYHFSIQDLSPNGFAAFDIETSQQEPEEQMRLGQKTQILSVHRLFCLGFSWSLDGQPLQSRVLYRINFNSDYAMMQKLVEELVALAELNSEAEKERKKDVWARLDADDVVLTGEAPLGFHQRRLQKLMKKLRRRLNTLVVLGWNSSRFDLPLLIGCGFLAALKEKCPHINLLKRSSTSYMVIEASDSEHKFTLRFVDALLFSSVFILCRI